MTFEEPPGAGGITHWAGLPVDFPAGRAPVRGAAREATGRGEIVGVPFGTNAAAFAAAGVSSVVFGPGCIDQAHTADEWLDLEQLSRASEILYRFGRSVKRGLGTGD